MPIKQVNVVTALVESAGLGQRVIGLRTYFPSAPKVFLTCFPPQDVPQRMDRLGQRVPHGLRKWVPILSGEHDPAYTDGTDALFDFGDPCPSADLSWWAAGIQGTGPELDWSTVVRPALDVLPPGSLWGIARSPASWHNINATAVYPLNPTDVVGTLPFDTDTFVWPGPGTLSLVWGVNAITVPQAPTQRVQLIVHTDAADRDYFSAFVPARSALLLPAFHVEASWGVEVVADLDPAGPAFLASSGDMTVAALWVPD